MSRLIRESDVQDMLDDAQCISDGEYSYVCTEDIKLSKLPTIDAVSVVRCGECRWWSKDEPDDEYGYCYNGKIIGSTKENWHCADGKRKEKKNESKSSTDD